MDGFWIRPTLNQCLRELFAACVVGYALTAFARLQAEQYRDPCDSSRVSWELQDSEARVEVRAHRRDGIDFHSGTAAEAIDLVTAVEGQSVTLAHAVPVGLLIDDLTAAVWIKANRTGAALAVRVHLPQQRDPRTGEELTFIVQGDTYANVNQWQELTCQTLEQTVSRQLALVRRQLAGLHGSTSINLQNMYVDEVLLLVPLSVGHTAFSVDDLRFGPIVRPQSDLLHSPAAFETANVERPKIPIQLETDRILLNGEPFFPRIVPYHRENLDSLEEMRVNVVWVENHSDRVLMDALQQRGIWAMTTPPRSALVAEGETTASHQAHLMPLSTETSPVLFWTVGTRIPGSELPSVQDWIQQIEAADRCYSRARPVVADVMQREREFSRHVSLLGTSRHFLHTSFAPLQYRNHLLQRKQRALPDVFNWTWIQTEPSTAHLAARDPDRHAPIVVEAEQIWLQAWAAVSAGHKALGYWTYSPLDETDPAAQERRIALGILNSQLELLEPWLAAGKLVDTIPVTFGAAAMPDAGRRPLGFRSDTTRGAGARPYALQQPSGARDQHEVQAAVLESEFGRLLLVAWYQDGAQYQPGSMRARDVRMKVRGIEMARAWEVSTTGVRPLRSERVAGGMEVQLDDLDQVAFVVITNDTGLEEKLSQKMRTLRPRCGRLWTELAALRLSRVMGIHEKLAGIAPAVPEAQSLLSAADNAVQRAQAQLQRTQYDAARDESRQALQLLRTLERRHWDQAVQALSQPVSSPHAVCFSTLPDHWRLMNVVGPRQDRGAQNLLRSGGFEDLDTMMAAGWKPELETLQGIHHVAELHPQSAAGRYSVRLASFPETAGSVSAELLEDSLVRLKSPSLLVRGGQVVVINGLLRIDSPIAGHPDGLMIYDNIKGTVGALRFSQRTQGENWEAFEIVREVPTSQEIQVYFDLHGQGVIRLDEVRLVALTADLDDQGDLRQEGGENPRRGLLDFPPALPKVRFWPARPALETPAETADELPINGDGR